MEELRVRTLGGLELSLGDRPLTEVVSAKGRALVAHLAIAGTRISRSRLAGLLWSDLPEDSARANLRLTLSKLRPAVPHLRTDRTSVWIDGPHWDDIAELDRLAGGSADPSAVLELAPGEFLDGVELAGAELFEEWVAGERARIRSSVLALLDETVGKAEIDGSTDVGVVAARRILSFEPCNEQAHRSLMRLFASAGQPSAAIAQGDTCQHVLWEQLGQHPAEETLALADQIRRSATIAPPLPPAMPADPETSFLGRAAELEHLGRLVSDPAYRLVTLVGPGGIGKTRVAIELAARLGAQGKSVAFVSLAGAPPARGAEARDLLVTTLAAGLGVELATERDPLDALVERVGGCDLLLVVDNIEHLADAEAVLGRLVAGPRPAKLLITSRRRLGLGGEWVVELHGLAVPPPGALGDLGRYDAVRLFVDRARAAGATGRLDPDTVSVLCRAVEGMPLALELAARQARIVPLGEIAKRLHRGLDLLAGASDPDRRHRSMRAALDWSWELLDPPTAHSLARLSVFPSAFSPTAADAVADVPLTHLSGLAEQSLLRLTDDGRYDMHQLIRQYAAERLAGEPQRAAEVAAAHAHWVASRMAGAEQVALDDVRAATAWMIEHGDIDELAAHLERVVELYRRRSYWAELRTIAHAALQRPGLAPHLRAEWLGVAADAHREIGKAADAIDLTHQALAALGRALPETAPSRLVWMTGYAARLALGKLGFLGSAQRRRAARVLSSRLISLGELYYVGEQFEGIPVLTVGGFVEGRLSADPDTVADGDLIAAVALTIAGRHGLARRYRRRAVAQARGPDAAPRQAGHKLMSAAVVCLAVGDWDDAMEVCTLAVQVNRRAGQQRDVELAMLLHGIAHYCIGDYDSAMAAADDVVAAAVRRGAFATLMWGHVSWAEAGLRAGLRSEAAARATAAIQLANKLEARIDRIRALVVLARTALAAGRPADTERALTQASRDMADRPAYSSYTLEAHAGIPEIALDLLEAGHGDRPRLEAVANGGLDVVRRYARAVPIAIPHVHLVSGRLAHLAHRHRAARRAFGRALSDAERLSMPWELHEARSRLGE